jgi:hypothetical protein
MMSPDHYSDLVDRIKDAKRGGNLEEAETLLLRAIESTEQEAATERWGVAPWYYEQLAIVYRKQNRYQDEIGILERYAKQPKAPGAGPQKLAERLAKAKARGG